MSSTHKQVILSAHQQEVLGACFVESQDHPVTLAMIAKAINEDVRDLRMSGFTSKSMLAIGREVASQPAIDITPTTSATAEKSPAKAAAPLPKIDHWQAYRELQQQDPRAATAYYRTHEREMNG